MKEILFVRHGETDWNVEGRLQGKEDVPLNTRGESQAYHLAEALLHVGIEKIVTSYLSRARRTAEIVSQRLSIADLAVVDGLHERDYGEVSGLTQQERLARFPQGASPSGQESFSSLRERVTAAFNEIVTRHVERKILVVSHGGVINSLLAHFSNGELGTGKTILANCSVSKVTRTADSWNLEYFNVSADVLAAHERVARVNQE